MSPDPSGSREEWRLTLSLYSIEVEGGRRLVAVDVFGFWSLETVSEFARDLDAAIRRLGLPGGHVVVLGFDDAQIAAGPVVEALQHLIASAPTRAGRIAFHAASALKRMQVGRIANAREGTSVFATRKEAIAWAAADLSAEQ